jgi:hypothetical protein
MLRGLRTVRRALLLGCTLQASQQLIGINTIMYYASEILSKSGFGDKDNPGTAMLMSTAVAGANAFFTLVAIVLVDLCRPTQADAVDAAWRDVVAGADVGDVFCDALDRPTASTRCRRRRWR